jgi:hypothetical protein
LVAARALRCNAGAVGAAGAAAHFLCLVKCAACVGLVCGARRRSVGKGD